MSLHETNSYIEIREVLNFPIKTKRWTVHNKANGYRLGTIGFYPHWRKYVFYPSNESLFDASCLLAIGAILDAETLKWRANL